MFGARGRLALVAALIGLAVLAVVGSWWWASRWERVDLLAAPLAGEVVHDTRLVDLGGEDAETLGALLGGWSFRERGWDTSFAWVDESNAAVRFFATAARDTLVHFRARPSATEPPLSASIVANGQPVGELTFRPGWREYDLTIPAAALRRGFNTLAFQFSQLYAGAAGDTRQLAAAFDFIRFGSSDGSLPAPATAEVPAGEGPLRLAPGEGARFVVRIAPDAMLKIDVACGRGSGHRSTVAVWLRDPTSPDAPQVLSRTPLCGVVDGHRVERLDTPLPAAAPMVGELYIVHEADASTTTPVTLERVTLVRRKAAPTARPNVVLIVLDALRADHLHGYGYARKTSPVLDRLAELGVVFTQAFAQAPMTIGSVPSLLTGAYPPVHQVTERDALGPDLPTLAEVLAAHGYATAAFSANPFVTPAFGLARGFAFFAPLSISTPAHLRGVDDVVRAETVVAAVTEWLVHSPAQPFFLFVQFLQPHTPYAPPPPHHDLFGPPGAFDGRESTLLAAEQGEPAAAMAVRQTAIDRYDENIHYVDAAVGRMLGVLKQLGILHQTVVIVTSDHGEQFFGHGRFGHPAEILYETSLHVPLIVHAQGVAGGRRVDALAESIDIPATVLDLAGIDTAIGQGRSLVPLLRGGSRTEQPVLAFAREFPVPAEGSPYAIEALRTRDRKLIRYPAAAPELFDLADDPGEQRNLAAANPEAAAALSVELEERRSALPAGCGAGAVHLDDSSRERLRALGYLR